VGGDLHSSVFDKVVCKAGWRLRSAAATGVVAAIVFEWVGACARAWVNVDLLWVLALLVTGGFRG
jgi:hypothetical protein